MHLAGDRIGNVVGFHSGLNVSDVTGFNSGLNVGLLGVIELVVLKVETVDEAQMTLLP